MVSDIRIIRDKAIALGIIKPTVIDVSEIDQTNDDILTMLSDKSIYDLIVSELGNRNLLDILNDYDYHGIVTEEWLHNNVYPGSYLYELLEDELNEMNYFGKKTKKIKLFWKIYWYLIKKYVY